MFKIIWQTIKEEITLITKDSKAFLGAIASAAAAVLLIFLIKVMFWNQDSSKGWRDEKELRRLDEERHSSQVIILGNRTRDALFREQDWRDTANKYKYLYEETHRK